MSLHDAEEALRRFLPMLAAGQLPYADAEALWAARDAALAAEAKAASPVLRERNGHAMLDFRPGYAALTACRITLYATRATGAVTCSACLAAMRREASAKAEADRAMIVDIRALFCLWDGAPLQMVLDFLRREARRPDPDVTLRPHVAVLHQRGNRTWIVARSPIPLARRGAL